MLPLNFRRLAVVTVAAMTCAVGALAGPSGSALEVEVDAFEHTSIPAPPRVATDVDQLVNLRTGRGGMCSATPIRGTTAVVTAAHCLVDRSIRHHPVDGSFALRNQSVYFEVGGVAVDNRAGWFTVHPSYFGEHPVEYDVAVVYTRHAWPFGAAAVGLDAEPVVELAAYGLQRIGEGGYRLDRDDVRERFQQGLAPPLRAPAGCSLPLDLFDTDARTVVAECGLVDGASGGPVLARTADDVRLVGVVSSVSGDRRSNWFVSGRLVEELLDGVGLFVELSNVPDRVELAAWETVRRPSSP